MKETSFTFPKKHKLLKHEDFVVCYAKGKKIHSNRCILFFYNKKDMAPWRFGVGVSKKNGNAVVRNRMKRVLREFARLQLQEFPAGYDIIVVPKKNIVLDAFTYSSLLTELLPTFHKALKQSNLQKKSAPSA